MLLLPRDFKDVLDGWTLLLNASLSTWNKSTNYDLRELNSSFINFKHGKRALTVINLMRGNHSTQSVNVKSN